MHEIHLAYFKKNLENLLEELLDHAGNTANSLRESQGSIADPLDRASFDEHCSFSLRIRTRESVLIRKIKRSLEDIENGEYGICEDCGGDISIARLNARPMASRCIDCKRKQEDRERVISC